MDDIKNSVVDYINKQNKIPSKKDFKMEYPRLYKIIDEEMIDFTELIIGIGYDPYGTTVIDYGSMSDDELLGIIKGCIKDFTIKYSYIPNEQIYKILPLPSLKYLSIRLKLTYAGILKRIDCDKVNGYKIYRHIPNDVLTTYIRTKVDEYIKEFNKLPSKTAFNEFKIGTTAFYESRFNMGYYDLLVYLGYSLELKHKPLRYKDFSKEEIFNLTKSEIANYIVSNGKVPTQFEYRKLNAPSEIYFKKKYGLTYNELLLTLGFKPIKSGETYKYLSDEQVYAKLKVEIESFAKDKNRLPNAQEYLLLDVPSLGYLKKRFNLTYMKLIEHLGFKEIYFVEGYYMLSDNEIFNKIKYAINDFMDSENKIPTQKQYDNLKVPSIYILKKIYGLSYSKLLKGIDIKK